MSVALVTGAAGGLGAAVAARLAQDHAVLLTGVNTERLKEVTEKLATEGAKVAHDAGDVSQRASVQSPTGCPQSSCGSSGS